MSAGSGQDLAGRPAHAGVLGLLAGMTQTLVGARAVVSTQWLRVLLSVLGGLQMLMAVTAAPAFTMVVGVAGGLAVLATWAATSRRNGLLLVTVGTAPFAVLTWTGLAPPLVAVLAVGIAAALPPRPGRRSTPALLVVPGVDPA